MAIEITLKNSNQKLKIITIYRPNSGHNNLTPTEQFNQSMELLSNMLENIGDSPSILCGDLNIDVLKYNFCNSTNEYVNLLFANGFIQTINKPTRCTSSSATLIDHCLTNVLSNTYSSTILTTTISDHFPIIIKIKASKNKIEQKVLEYRNFSLQNITNFKLMLQNENWQEVLNSSDTQSAYNAFHDKFFQLYELFFPLIKTKFNRNIHKLEQWYTQGLLTSRITKLKLDKIASQCPSVQNIQRFKQYRCIYNKLLKSAKKLYYDNELVKHKSNLKKTWTLLRQALNRKAKKSDHNIACMKINGKLNFDPSAIAEHLNNHFTTAPSAIIENIHPVPNQNDNQYEDDINEKPIFNIRENQITVTEIVETVKLLESKKSYDCNGISMYFIKKCIFNIARPLQHIFNLSFTEAQVPNQFKIAKIIPVFKGGDPGEADNYRPIALLSNISKILEKRMGLRLTAYLESNALISISQYGFRQGHSTIHPMLHFHNTITSAFNNKEHAIAIFCDMRKAFDTIDHSILL